MNENQILEEESRDRSRQVIELAITSGRTFQSPQTGFIHYCYFAKDEERHDTIPLYDNFLFCLALFRKKKSDTIQEAKDNLEKLLNFQNPFPGQDLGSFPVYVHEFPRVKDKFFGIYLLAPLYWILQEYTLVLGKELEESVKAVSQKLLKFSIQAFHAHEAPFPFAIRLAGAMVAFGRLWQDEKLKEEGEALFTKLHHQTEEGDFGYWFSPISIADTLVALQMTYKSIENSPWKFFWKKLPTLWHSLAKTYAGPAVRVYQRQYEPEPTLYDLFMGFYTGDFPYHSFISHPFQLQGALIYPTEDKMVTLTYPFHESGKIVGLDWHLHQSEEFAYSSIQTTSSLSAPSQYGIHPFRLVWGEMTRIHTLVCQGGRATHIHAEPKEGGVDLVFFLDEELQPQDKEKMNEIIFFQDKFEGLKILVENNPASVFNFKDRLILKSLEKTVTLRFIHEGGEGRFLGHIQPGNRPAQTSYYGDFRFQTFDWRIFLRTIKRFTACQIRVEVRVLE